VSLGHKSQIIIALENIRFEETNDWRGCCYYLGLAIGKLKISTQRLFITQNCSFSSFK
jgi:hypothetical protein